MSPFPFLSDDGLAFQNETDPEPRIETIDCDGGVEEALSAHATLEMNHVYERPVCRPFRFSVLDAGPGGHYLVAAYDHWAADSVSARMILHNVLSRYLGFEIPDRDAPLQTAAGTYRRVFGRHLRGLGLLRAAARSLRQWNRNRSAWRVAYWSSTQWDVKYQSYGTQPGTIARLHDFAKSLGATVHDVVLAALGRAMMQIMPARGRDRDLALGSIVDTRGCAEADLSRTLGVFLGYYLVRTKPDAAADLAETTRRIAARSRPIKDRHEYLDSAVNLKFINALWPRLPEKVKPYFMRGALPMTAGASNVLIREPWMLENRDVILDYRRAAPTGPMLPLTLAPSTFGDQLNIGVTYRIAGFPRAKIDTVMEMLLDQIEHPEHAAHAPLRRAA